VSFDICEGFLERRFGCVARKGFEDGGGVGGPDFGNGGLDGVGASGEECDGEVAVRGGREDARDS
jgi:hypothetical protein